MLKLCLYSCSLFSHSCCTSLCCCWPSFWCSPSSVLLHLPLLVICSFSSVHIPFCHFYLHSFAHVGLWFSTWSCWLICQWIFHRHWSWLPHMRSLWHPLDFALAELWCWQPWMYYMGTLVWCCLVTLIFICQYLLRTICIIWNIILINIYSTYFLIGTQPT